jgi:hypothetical protein
VIIKKIMANFNYKCTADSNRGGGYFLCGKNTYSAISSGPSPFDPQIVLSPRKTPEIADYVFLQHKKIASLTIRISGSLVF